MDALKSLNQEQLKAATAPLGNNLIIASAGTGKTSTIVARIAHLLNIGIKPEKILLLTFTNKAAKEMISRLNRYFDSKIIQNITAGTFHAVSFALLKKINKNVVLKQPRELKTLLKSISEKRDFYKISDKKPYGGAYLYDIYALFLNSCNDDFIDWFCKNYDEEQAEFAEIYEDILKDFEIEKKKFNYVDFNDLLIKMKNELLKGAPINFDEILVDEYQDTNSLQGSLIDAFNRKSLFCVGDFDQSIYAFNGANINIIGGFKDRYLDAKTFSLNINYRSSDQILLLANRVIANNPRLYPKNLIVQREGDFKPPILATFNENFQQYEWVAKKISQNKNVNYEEIAVIFRNNSSADGMEIALKEQGIKSRRKGGISFFENLEIKAVLDILAILANPKDIMSFINIISYARGIGNAAAKDIFDALILLGKNIINGFLNPDNNVKIFGKKTKKVQLGLFDDVSFDDSKNFDIKGDFKDHKILNYSKLNSQGAEFLSQMYEFFKITKDEKNPSKLISVIKNSNLFNLIANQIATKRATNRAGQLNLDLKNENLTKISNKILTLYQMSRSYDNLEKFYNFITIGSNEIEEGSGVNLLSVHASKGLEFKQVFIVDLAQDRFPNSKLMAMGGSLEEERRLFYVAVTRAKDELYMTYAKEDKMRKIKYEPSQFLKEGRLLKDE